MGADPVMFSAVVPRSHSPKSDILPGLAFGGQVTISDVNLLIIV